MNTAIDTLSRMRREFGIEARRRRLAALAMLRKTPFDSTKTLCAAHDEALFCRAYADDAPVAREAEATLRAIADAAHAIARRRENSTTPPLKNSGIAGAHVIASFSFDLVRWLATKNPPAKIEWENDWAGQTLDDLLPILGIPAEADSSMTNELPTREWLQRACGRFRGGALPWLCEQIARLDASPDVRDRLFKSLDLYIRWRVPPAASRTLARFPARPLFPQRDALLRNVPIRDWIARRPPPPRRLERRDALRMIDLARAVLAARCRETDPVTYANPREIEMFALERGVDVALFGLQPSRRLPIESYFGFLAARNCVPIAYGGGWVFFGRCEIGVNLFEEFRGGESALIFAQVLRTYAWHYRVRQFLVDSFQFGEDNPEAIRSGAYWFYHRLGFRSTSAELRRIADREQQAMNQSPAHRTSPRILKRLATAPLFLNLHAAPRDGGTYVPVAPDLIRIAQRVSATIGRDYAGDRARALADAIKRTTPQMTEWSAEATQRFAPWMMLVRDLARWPSAERRRLAQALNAKLAPRERSYALALQRCERLRTTLMAAAQAR